MNLDDAGLHQPDQAGEIVDRQHRLLLADINLSDRRIKPVPRMLGKKTLAADA